MAFQFGFVDSAKTEIAIDEFIGRFRLVFAETDNLSSTTECDCRVALRSTRRFIVQ